MNVPVESRYARRGHELVLDLVWRCLLQQNLANDQGADDSPWDLVGIVCPVDEFPEEIRDKIVIFDELHGLVNNSTTALISVRYNFTAVVCERVRP